RGAVQRQGFPVGGDPAGRRVRQDLGQRGGLLLIGERVIGVAEHGKHPAAQGGRAESGQGGGGGTEVDQPTVRRQHPQGGLGGHPPDRVEQQVHPVAGGLRQPRG